MPAKITFLLLVPALFLCCATGGTDTPEPLPPGVIPPGTVAIIPADGHDINVLLADELRLSLSGALVPVPPDVISGAIPSYPHMPHSLAWDVLEMPGIVPSRLDEQPGATVMSLLHLLKTDYILVLWVGGVERIPNVHLPLVEEYTIRIRGFLVDRKMTVPFISRFQAYESVFFTSDRNETAGRMIKDAAMELADALGTESGGTR